MAEFKVYSLDWTKFSSSIDRPTSRQLLAFAELLAEGLEDVEGEFDEDDVILDWPPDRNGLAPIVAQRLAKLDWYADLSTCGKALWEHVLLNAAFECHPDLDWDCRSEGEAVSREALACVAGTSLGSRPLRSAESKGTNWTPNHSLHTPEEVRQLQGMIESRKALAEANGLIQTIAKVAKEGRGLLVCREA